MGHTYYSLFFVTIAALVSPWIGTRMFRSYIPSIAIEIVLGILFGPSLLHFASSTSFIHFLAEFGFSYLMFISGLELDFDLLLGRNSVLSQEKHPTWIKGLLFFLFNFTISLLIAYLLYYAHLIQHPLIVALIISTTSIGVILPALKEKGWLASPYGQSILIYSLAIDIGTLFLITGVVTVHVTGNALSLFLIIGVILLFIIVYLLLKFFMRFKGWGMLESATSEMGMRGSFALILLFLAFSETLGTEVVVGAFLAGAMISLLTNERNSLLVRKLNTIGYGFLIPVFFVNVGLTFNISKLHTSISYWVILGIILVMMYANKLLVGIWFFRNFPYRQRMAASLLMTSGLSLIIAISQIALNTGMISAAEATSYTVLAIVTSITSPALFSRLLSKVAVPSPDETHEIPNLTIDSRTLPSGWVIDQITINSKKVNGLSLRSLRLPADVLFISIERGDERIVPRGHSTLEQSDVVHVLGDPMSIAKVRRIFKN